MGKVYRALDTRLGRPVAIKISAEQFSKRFEHEARVISALNPPHKLHAAQHRIVALWRELHRDGTGGR